MKKGRITQIFIFFTILLSFFQISVQINQDRNSYGLFQPKISEGPIDIFDMGEILNNNTLQPIIISNITITINNTDIQELKVNIYSSTWFGQDIYNTMTIYIPEDIPQENWGKAAVLLQGGTVQLDPTLDFIRDFGQNTALSLKIPICLITSPINPSNYGYASETELAVEFRKIMLLDNNLLREIAYPLAIKQMRAMTYMTTLDIAKNPINFITGGSSKRGLAQWIVASVDNRVIGFLSSAYAAPDLLNYWELVENNWGGESPLGDAAESREWLLTPVGMTYQEYFDPYQFSDTIDVPFILMVGTNDNYYPLEAANSLLLKLDNPKALELVPNYPHGMGSIKHLQNWRTIIQASLIDRKFGEIINNYEINATTSKIIINTNITNSEEIKDIKCWFTINEDLDFRSANWDSRTMNYLGFNRFEIILDFTSKIKNYGAFFIELIDEKNNTIATTTSLVKIINLYEEMDTSIPAILGYDYLIVISLVPIISILYIYKRRSS